MAGVLTKFSTAMPDNLKKGDLIEISRTLGYCHWAVFIGDGKVIHLTSPRENSFEWEKGVVETKELTELIKGSTCRINNSKDKLFEALPDDDISNNAQSALEHPELHPDYNFLINNCEHFASYCRYGVAYSKQAKIGKDLRAKALKILLLPKIRELSKCMHEKHGRMASEIIEAVQNIAAQIPCLNEMQASVSSASTVWNHLHLVGLVLKVLGCVLKQANISQGLGEEINDFGNKLMEMSANEILVSIAGTLDPALTESEVLKGIADLAIIILHICNGDYGHAFFSLVAAVWPYLPAAIRDKVEAAQKAAVNKILTAAKCIYSWLSSVKCIFF